LISMSAFSAYLSNPKTQKILTRKPGDEGFSLIELVVVVAVLAILAAIAIPAFTSINDKAAVSAAQNTLVQIVKECAVKKANGEALNFTPPNLNSYTVTPADGACIGNVTVPRVDCQPGQTMGNDNLCDGTPTSDSKVLATRKDGASTELPTTISVSFATGEKECEGGNTKFCPASGIW